jgi:hypothetical protein
MSGFDRRFSPRRKKKNPQTLYGRGSGRGGGERTRTADPLHAKQVLYQLSYTPHGDDPGF